MGIEGLVEMILMSKGNRNLFCFCIVRRGSVKVELKFLIVNKIMVGCIWAIWGLCLFVGGGKGLFVLGFYGGDMVRMGALVRKRICLCAIVFKVAVYKLVKI